VKAKKSFVRVRKHFQTNIFCYYSGVNITVLDAFHTIFYHTVKLGNMIIAPKPTLL